MRMLRNEAFSVVIVCTGNLVRSPYAATLLQDRCDALRPGRVVVASAGTEARDGLPVDARAAASLARHGIAAPASPSTRLDARTLIRSDLVLGASEEHVRYAMTMAPSILHRTFTLTRLAMILATMPESPLGSAGDPVEAMRARVRRAADHRSLGADAGDVPDPYGRGDDVHAVMVEMVDAAVASIVDGLFAPVRRP